MTTPIGPFNLTSTYLRLRPDSGVDPLPVTQDFWPKLMSGEIELGSHDRLVTMFSFDQPWANAERHPAGDEIVCLVAGGPATLVLFDDDGDGDGRERAVELAAPGAYAIVPKGTWHTARTAVSCTMLFITLGEGNEHRAIE